MIKKTKVIKGPAPAPKPIKMTWKIPLICGLHACGTSKMPSRVYLTRNAPLKIPIMPWDMWIGIYEAIAICTLVLESQSLFMIPVRAFLHPEGLTTLYVNTRSNSRASIRKLRTHLMRIEQLAHSKETATGRRMK